MRVRVTAQGGSHFENTALLSLREQPQPNPNPTWKSKPHPNRDLDPNPAGTHAGPRCRCLRRAGVCSLLGSGSPCASAPVGVGVRVRVGVGVEVGVRVSIRVGVRVRYLDSVVILELGDEDQVQVGGQGAAGGRGCGVFLVDALPLGLGGWG